MGVVHDLLASRSDIELEFVRHRHRGRVHVAVPHDPNIKPETVPIDDLDEEAKLQAALSFTRKPVPTLCGRAPLVYFDGVTGDHEIVDTFDDNDLCWSCHRALGPEHSSRAFEHPRPIDPSQEGSE